MKESGEEIIAQKYQLILADIKAKGHRVFHRKMPKDISGLYDPVTQIITIDKILRNTLEGCEVLLHEFSHLLDHREGFFKKFYDINETKLEYSDELMDLIIKAEQSASKRAEHLLKQWSIYVKADNCKPEKEKYYKDFWRKYYFDS